MAGVTLAGSPALGRAAAVVVDGVGAGAGAGADAVVVDGLPPQAAMAARAKSAIVGLAKEV